MVLEAQAKASLPIIKSAREHGRRVIAAAPHRVCAGLLSRYASDYLVYPSAVDQPEACAGFLLEYLSGGHIDMLYPVGDVMTDLVAQHQDTIRRHTRLVLPQYEVFKAGRDKILTLQAAARAGADIPRTWYPHEQPLEDVAHEASYPCFIKPAISAGARGMTLVDGPEMLVERFPAVEAEYGRLFLQEFVPQHGMQYKVDAVMSPGGTLLAGVVYDKQRYYPSTGGSSVLNCTVHRPDILAMAERVMRELGWVGLCDFDFITDPRDGVVKLIEINPRFPESFRATFVAGVDMVEMLWQLAHDVEPEPVLTYKVGRYLRFLPGDVMWLLTSGDRFRQLGSWLSFLSPKVTYQVLSLKDPGPFVGYLLENLGMLLDRKKRRERFRLSQATRKTPPR